MDEDLKRAKRRGYVWYCSRKSSKNYQRGNTAGENCDHGLTDSYGGCRECHIAPDWLLIYEIAEETLILYLMRTGSHSDLF